MFPKYADSWIRYAHELGDAIALIHEGELRPGRRTICCAGRRRYLRQTSVER